MMAAGQQEPVVDMSKCKAAVFSHSTILCKAGLNEKPLPMITRKACVGPKVETFVKMGVSEPWLCKAVTGSVTPSHTSISRTTLLDELLVSVKQACDGEIPSEDAAVVTAEDGDEDDPMNEVDAGEAETPAKPAKRTRKRPRTTPQKYTYAPNAAKNKVVVVQHQEVPEEVDPNSEALRKILLFIQDRRSVWIPITEVDWAVKYLYVQNRLKGVGHVGADSAGPGGN